MRWLTVGLGTDTHPNAHMLRDLYSDFSLLSEHASDDMIVHPAARTAGASPINGLSSVASYLSGLYEATGGTAVLEVESVQANDFFGAVLGILRLSSPAELAMPFCGLWRFDRGRIVEHWENLHSTSAFFDATTPHS